MKCFYCGLEMNLDTGIYECMQINGKFGHTFEMDSDLKKNYKELRFFINKNSIGYDDYGYYTALFYSIEEFFF